jgi:hypothetical protein
VRRGKRKVIYRMELEVLERLMLCLAESCQRLAETVAPQLREHGCPRTVESGKTERA